MNSVQVMGNLARDPVVRATKTGRAMASFTVAVNRSFTTPQGEQREITDWINVVAWGNLAEAVGNQLKKGSRVFVDYSFLRYTRRTEKMGQRSDCEFRSTSDRRILPFPAAAFGQCFRRK